MFTPTIAENVLHPQHNRNPEHANATEHDKLHKPKETKDTGRVFLHRRPVQLRGYCDGLRQLAVGSGCEITNFLHKA